MDEKFLSSIECAVRSLAGDSYVVERHAVAKGTKVKDALRIGYKGGSVQVVVYPEEGEGSVEKYAAKLFAIAQKALKEDSVQLAESVKDMWKNLPDVVSIKLVNTAWQKEYLKNKIYRECFGELAMVPVLCTGRCSIAINKGAWNEEEILEAGLRNFLSAEKKCEPLESVLQKIAPGMIGAEEFPEDFPTLYMLTVEKGLFGGACLLDEVFLRRVRDVVGGDYYILPSSVYELLCIRADEEAAEEFKKMIYFVNREHVEYNERLSDSLYIYREGKVSRVDVEA